jgi:PKHD-type hydroxylase
MTTTTDSDSNFTNPSFMQTSKMASLDILSINKSELFSSEESTQILQSCIEELWLPVSVIGNEKLHSGKRQRLRGAIEGFPFEPIRVLTKMANDEIYDFKLLGIIDQDFPQVFKYVEHDFYDWHIELNPMAPSRKITFIINLSNKLDYDGGDIEFLNSDTSTDELSKQGSCLIFPSFMPYKITPVTRGAKHIIVGHIHGAVFR